MNEAAIPTDSLDAEVFQDWSKPCEATHHNKWGGGSHAEWIVWQATCCEHRPPFGLICDPCLKHHLDTPGVRCRQCHATWTPGRLSILRTERLDGVA